MKSTRKLCVCLDEEKRSGLGRPELVTCGPDRVRCEGTVVFSHAAQGDGTVMAKRSEDHVTTGGAYLGSVAVGPGLLAGIPAF